MPLISRDTVLAAMRRERYAVQASVSPDGTPQSAIVGVVVSDELEIFFDTLVTSRKAINLRDRPYAAFVFGSTAADAASTLQIEGVVDEPSGADLARLLELYFAQFPDGRERQQWPAISYWRLRPAWIRYSDYAASPPLIVELSGDDLRSPR